MAAKITAIADKDLGQVFGAVLELNATDKLSVATVAGPGFLLRGKPSSPGEVLPDGMLLPSTELDTYGVTSNAVLIGPQGFTMVDGVATGGLAFPPGKEPTLTTPANAPPTITFTIAVPSSSVKVKVFFSDQATHTVDVMPVVSLNPKNSAGTAFELTAPALLSGNTYDLLVLVEKHKAHSI